MTTTWSADGAKRRVGLGPRCSVLGVNLLSVGLPTIGFQGRSYSREALPALTPTPPVDTAAQLESVLLGT